MNVIYDTDERDQSFGEVVEGDGYDCENADAVQRRMWTGLQCIRTAFSVWYVGDEGVEQCDEADAYKETEDRSPFSPAFTKKIREVLYSLWKEFREGDVYHDSR